MFASDPAAVARASPGHRVAGPLPGTLSPGETVGETPLVPLRAVAREVGGEFELWGKLESANPSGSVKDRAASAIVRAALADGRLARGTLLVDATSGNTGVAYARLGAQLGFAVRLYVPRNANPARLASMREFGAEVVLTDPAEGTDGARREAAAFVDGDPAHRFFADQYSNPENPRAHYTGTGPEIWRQSRGAVSHLVAGVGTGGTISGAGRYLKERRPTIRVVAVEPTGPMHGLEGLKHLPTAVWPATYDASVPDETVRVDTEEAIATAGRVLREEKLAVGRSAGAAISAAVGVGARTPGAFVVVIVPDAGSQGPEAEP